MRGMFLRNDRWRWAWQGGRVVGRGRMAVIGCEDVGGFCCWRWAVGGVAFPFLGFLFLGRGGLGKLCRLL